MNALSPTRPLYSCLADDPDLAELVELFVQEMPQRIAQLQSAYLAGDLEQLGRTAHQLKGAAGSYGFHQLTPHAARLDAAARSGATPETIVQCLNELTAMCGSVRAGREVSG